MADEITAVGGGSAGESGDAGAAPKGAANVGGGAKGSVVCGICFDEIENGQRAMQRCAHNYCSSCFAHYLQVCVEDRCDPYPRCPTPKCHAVASEALVGAHVSVKLTARMRYLRGLRPGRADDGRRMWCVARGCFEPLAPPPEEPARQGPQEREVADEGRHSRRQVGSLMDSMLNLSQVDLRMMFDDSLDDLRRAASRFVHPERSEPEPVTLAVRQSECGACGTRACMRCAAPAHEGACSVPTTNLREQQLYAQYAVGRIAACPSCGAHVERSGGCNMMTCSRCVAPFIFRPFATVREVQESLAFVSPHATTRPAQPPQRQPGPRRSAIARLAALRTADRLSHRMLLRRLNNAVPRRPEPVGRLRYEPARGDLQRMGDDEFEEILNDFMDPIDAALPLDRHMYGVGRMTYDGRRRNGRREPLMPLSYYADADNGPMDAFDGGTDLDASFHRAIDDPRRSPLPRNRAVDDYVVPRRRLLMRARAEAADHDVAPFGGADGDAAVPFGSLRNARASMGQGARNASEARVRFAPGTRMPNDMRQDRLDAIRRSREFRRAANHMRTRAHFGE